MGKRKKMGETKNALAVFIKNPILGRAKTRIAKDSSDEKALEIYNNLLSITREIASESECKKYVFYDQFIDEEDQWKTEIFNKKLQSGNELGDKMYDAFTILKAENNTKSVLIGSDCPYLNPQIIQQAFNALEEHDFVIGPSYDGGYYLIGMKAPTQLVFSDIEWSQETVLEKTLDRIYSIGGSYFLLDKLNDIDHLEDWIEYTGKFN